MNAITQLPQLEEKNISSNLLSWIINDTAILVFNKLVDNVYNKKINNSKPNSYYPDFIVKTWIQILKNTNNNLKQTFLDIFVKNKYVWKLQLLELIDFFNTELVQNWWYKNTNFSLEDVKNILNQLKSYSKVLEIYSQHYVKITWENQEFIKIEYIDLEWNLKNVNIEK